MKPRFVAIEGTAFAGQDGVEICGRDLWSRFVVRRDWNLDRSGEPMIRDRRNNPQMDVTIGVERPIRFSSSHGDPIRAKVWTSSGRG
jgi:hypothetical protein